MKKGPASALALVASILAEIFEKPICWPTEVYFAGPGCLARDAVERRRHIDALCAKYGLGCLWPSERYLFRSGDKIKGRPLDVPEILHTSVIESIKDAAAIVADISPFRGPHLDAQTAFEIGYAAALGKPIFAWTNATYPAFPGAPAGHRRHATLGDRIWCGETAAADGHWRDEQGFLVENFDLPESSLISCAIEPTWTCIEDAICSCADYLKVPRPQAIAGVTPR
jgi:nucleoside 2-deoxyribosyltransferase